MLTTLVAVKRQAANVNVEYMFALFARRIILTLSAQRKTDSSQLRPITILLMINKFLIRTHQLS
jgi:hypothetical protein